MQGNFPIVTCEISVTELEIGKFTHHILLWTYSCCTWSGSGVWLANYTLKQTILLKTESAHYSIDCMPLEPGGVALDLQCCHGDFQKFVLPWQHSKSETIPPGLEAHRLYMNDQ